MKVYFRGAVCNIESGAPIIAYLTVQQPGMKTRTIRIAMGEPGLTEMLGVNQLFDDLQFQATRQGFYIARSPAQMSISLGDLEMMTQQAIKEEKMYRGAK